MSTQREHASNLPRSAALGVGDHESCTGLIAKSAQVTRRGSASSVYQRGPRRTAKADGRRRGPQLAATFAAEALGRWSEGGEGARKADKHRTEGGSHRPISAPSMWIVCHEALRAGPVQCFELLPNPARRRLAEYRRWTNGGRKVEPTDQFCPPHWRSIGYEHCSDETVVAVISPDWGRTLAPSACRHGSH